MSTHAKLSPSSAVRWMTCPGSVTLSEGIEDVSSSYANEGTDAHELAAICLTEGTNANRYLGLKMEKGHVVDDDMAMHVQTYLNHVRQIVGDGLLYVEQNMSIEHLTNEVGAKGTSDVVAIRGDELVIVDLKYGMGLRVSAEENPQLQMYAAAALKAFELVQDFKTVRMVIVQPRLNAISEWTQSVEQLESFIQDVQIAANNVQYDKTTYMPSTKACQFCRAKSICPAIEKEVMAGFEDVTTNSDAKRLADVMDKAHMIEGWVKAIRAEVERRLFAGSEIPGYKIVQGKRGHRKWTDAAAIEEMLKSMRLKHADMFEYSLISPTTAEKLIEKDVLKAGQWAKVMTLISQSEGSPSVAPDSDKRPAYNPSTSVDDFSDVS